MYRREQVFGQILYDGETTSNLREVAPCRTKQKPSANVALGGLLQGMLSRSTVL